MERRMAAGNGKFFGLTLQSLSSRRPFSYTQKNRVNRDIILFSLGSTLFQRSVLPFFPATAKIMQNRRKTPEHPAVEIGRNRPNITLIVGDQ